MQIERAAQQPAVSHIAAPAASWLDDFLSWTRCCVLCETPFMKSIRLVCRPEVVACMAAFLGSRRPGLPVGMRTTPMRQALTLGGCSPEIPQCCRAHPDGSRCPPPDQEPCKSKPDACTDCDPCFQPSPPDEDSGSGGDVPVQTTPNFRRSLRDFVAAYLHHGRPSLKQVTCHRDLP
jgi:hypothetical protein